MAALIPAHKKGRRLREGILHAREVPTGDRFDLWWLGQSGFLIQWNGRCILLDPYLSDSLTRKYAATGKPHDRMSERVISPDELDMIDIVTSSHNHTDHLDGETLIPVLKNNPGISFLIPEANRAFVAERVQCHFTFPTGLNDGEKVNLKGVTFYGVPAAHNTVERNESGQCKFMGYVLQFGKWSVYHSGDTILFDGIVDLLRPFQLDVALLPINGNDPSRGVAGNLSAREAAELGKNIGARLVIPHHYNMFYFNTADPDEFVREAKRVGQPIRVLELGGHYAGS